MAESPDRPLSTVGPPFLLLGAALASALLVSGCASTAAPSYVAWVPGSYEVQATHPEAGPVRGIIEVAEEGPVDVTTDVIGSCLAADLFTAGARDHTFQCAGDYRIHVRRGQGGEDPVVGEISNTRTQVETTRAQSYCVQRSTYPDGRSVCTHWAYRTVEEEVRTGSSRSFRVVSATRDRE